MLHGTLMSASPTQKMGLLDQILFVVQDIFNTTILQTIHRQSVAVQSW